MSTIEQNLTYGAEVMLDLYVDVDPSLVINVSADNGDGTRNVTFNTPHGILADDNIYAIEYRYTDPNNPNRTRILILDCERIDGTTVKITEVNNFTDGTSRSLKRVLNRKIEVPPVVFGWGEQPWGLGGWYGYRASKTALNQFIRTMANECRLKHPRAAIVAIHPGTTDTDLSRPFQANVDPSKLYSPQLTAKRLLKVLQDVDERHSGQFLNWNGSTIPW